MSLNDYALMFIAFSILILGIFIVFLVFRTLFELLFLLLKYRKKNGNNNTQ